MPLCFDDRQACRQAQKDHHGQTVQACLHAGRAQQTAGQDGGKTGNAAKRDERGQCEEQTQPEQLQDDAAGAGNEEMREKRQEKENHLKA